MSKNIHDTARAMLEAYRVAPLEGIREDVSDTYPHITIEDTGRIREGLLAVLDSKTASEQREREREYIALHAELKRKYRKSGKH